MNAQEQLLPASQIAGDMKCPFKLALARDQMSHRAKLALLGVVGGGGENRLITGVLQRAEDGAFSAVHYRTCEFRRLNNTYPAMIAPHLHLQRLESRGAAKYHR